MSLYNDFPRQVGLGREWVYDRQQLQEYINVNNGAKSCYISVYKFDKIIDGEYKLIADSSSAKIDKVFLDFDNRYGFQCFEIVRDYILKHDILSKIHLSSRALVDAIPSSLYDCPIGFHFYLFLKWGIIKDAIDLRIMHESLNEMIRMKLFDLYGIVFDRSGNKHGLKEGHVHEIIDPRIMGDVMRVSRIANTYNPSRNRFCVPLRASDLFLSPQKMLALTNNAREGGDFWIGNKLWSPPSSLFTDERRSKYKGSGNGYQGNGTVKLSISDAGSIPPCISFLLNKNAEGINMYHDERVFLASFLFKAGLSFDEINDIFRSQPDYSNDITSKHLKSIQEKGYMPSSCAKLELSNICKKNDQKYRHPLCFRRIPLRNPLAWWQFMTAAEHI